MRKDLLIQIDALRSSRQEHTNLLYEVLNADNRKIYGVDLIAIGVMHRSIALIDGFTRMAEENNALCANALLRLQLDNVIRFYACWLVDDPHSLALTLLEGKRLDRQKSKRGMLLKDAYLVSEASKVYPWLENVYKETSGFIHLSDVHMFAPYKVGEDGEISMEVGSHIGRIWKEDEILESLRAFGEATNSVLHLSYSWLVTKDGKFGR